MIDLDPPQKFWDITALLDWIGRLYNYVKPSVSPVTIASGEITVSCPHMIVDTESAAASDDLDTITPGRNGYRVILQAANSARTVVVKDGTGNMKLAGDMSLDNAEDTIELVFNNTDWYELSRSNNGV